MALHIAQLQEFKICSLLSSINEKSCMGLLHLWRRGQGPVSTAVWFVGSHKTMSCTWILQGSLLPSSLPSVQQPWPEGSPSTLIPSIWEEAACRSDESPTYFLLYFLLWNFPLLTYSIDFQCFATMTETSFFWELTHALYKLFKKLISCFIFFTPEMLTFENPREMMVNSRTGCRPLQWCPLP